MAEGLRARRWTDGFGAQIAIAVLFLVLTIAWLMTPARHTWSYWLPASSWALLASVWLTRAARQISARRSQRQH